MQRAAALLLLSVVVLGACGGDDAAGSDTGPRIVDASEFEFGDEVLEVAAGSDVIVELRDKGSLEHNWTLLDAGVAATTASDILPGDVIASVNADPARSESDKFRSSDQHSGDSRAVPGTNDYHDGGTDVDDP